MILNTAFLDTVLLTLGLVYVGASCEGHEEQVSEINVEEAFSCETHVLVEFCFSHVFLFWHQNDALFNEKACLTGMIMEQSSGTPYLG